MRLHLRKCGRIICRRRTNFVLCFSSKNKKAENGAVICRENFKPSKSLKKDKRKYFQKNRKKLWIFQFLSLPLRKYYKSVSYGKRKTDNY